MVYSVINILNALNNNFYQFWEEKIKAFMSWIMQDKNSGYYNNILISPILFYYISVLEKYEHFLLFSNTGHIVCIWYKLSLCNLLVYFVINGTFVKIESNFRYSDIIHLVFLITIRVYNLLLIMRFLLSTVESV